MGHVHKSPSAPHKLEALKAGLAGVGGPHGLALCLCQSGLRVSLSRHFCEPALCQASCQVPGIWGWLAQGRCEERGPWIWKMQPHFPPSTYWPHVPERTTHPGCSVL